MAEPEAILWVYYLGSTLCAALGLIIQHSVDLLVQPGV
jgi:hypothetical protein